MSDKLRVEATPLIAKKSGKLYCVGIGPGDPELLTLKALRILQTRPVIFVPEQSGSGRRQAFEIVRPYLDEAHQRIIPLHFPMTRDQDQLESAWDIATVRVVMELAGGQEAVFPVLGDPLLFGTFNYILNRLNRNYPEIEVEIVPGVTSIQAATAAAGLPLAEGRERITILPALYEEDAAKLEQTLADYDSVVLLKVGGALGRLLPILKACNRLEKAVYVERVGFPDQRIVRGQAIENLLYGKLPYFSLLIIKR